MRASFVLMLASAPGCRHVHTIESSKLRYALFRAEATNQFKATDALIDTLHKLVVPWLIGRYTNGHATL